MGCVIFGKSFLGEILDGHSVVGGNTYWIDTKMGGGKRPAVTFWETHRAKICLEMVLGFGEILYWHNVVGGIVNCTGVIYGVRTSLFLTSQRMPSRYGCDCKAIQLMIFSV